MNESKAIFRPIWGFMLFSLLAFGLSACGGSAYARAYTAVGEGRQESELRPNEQFTPTDDLNVVIKLNRRSDTVQVQARFIDPNGEILEEINQAAPENVGTMVLGISYAARADQINQWLRGRYRVEIRIDDELVETLYFRVD